MPTQWRVTGGDVERINRTSIADSGSSYVVHVLIDSSTALEEGLTMGSHKEG